MAENFLLTLRVATIPEKVTPTLTPAKRGSELTPVIPTPPKSCDLPYIVGTNPESDSDSFWEKSRLRATTIPGIVGTLVTLHLIVKFQIGFVGFLAENLFLSLFSST